MYQIYDFSTFPYNGKIIYPIYLDKRTFNYRNQFETCLIMKNWIPQKWPTLIYCTYGMHTLEKKFNIMFLYDVDKTRNFRHMDLFTLSLHTKLCFPFVLQNETLIYAAVGLYDTHRLYGFFF